MTKGRDSGMPVAEQWESYFDVAAILDSLGCPHVSGDVIEFGCGYGTFTIPLAQTIPGTVYTFDIDPLMVSTTASRVLRAQLKNVIVEERDFVAQGCGRADQSASWVLLFNILHIEDPVDLLQEARRVLCRRGLAGIIHWNYDERTPRGPSLEIRPRPEQCRAWGEEAGLQWVRDAELRGSRWHWGMVLQRL